MYPYHLFVTFLCNIPLQINTNHSRVSLKAVKTWSLISLIRHFITEHLEVTDPLEALGSHGSLQDQREHDEM